MENKEKNKIVPIIVGIVVIIFALGLVVYLKNYSSNKEVSSSVPSITPTQIRPTGVVESANYGPDPLNTSYKIEGQTITLINGKSEEQIPNSSIIVKTSNWNTPVEGSLTDFTGENKDASFILVQNSGGSGTFYYVVASLAANDGYIGTNGVLLGDRISPQNMNITPEKIIVVNYADRAEGTSMAEDPSEGKTKYLKVQGTELIEVSSLAE